MGKPDKGLSNEFEETVSVAEMQADRMGHTSATATRGAQHETRGRFADQRGLTKSEMIAKFRNEMYNNVLPSLPEIPGFHVCWLSTTSQNDTIAWRQSIGYELLKAEDMPGFDHITVTSGTYQGHIGCNELIASKLPLELYYEYMRIAHHERPMDHQNKMRSALEGIQQNARGDGVPIALADGSQSFCAASIEPRPMFTE